MSAHRLDTRRAREAVDVASGVVRRIVIGDKGGRPRHYSRKPLKQMTDIEGDWASRMIARARANEVTLREQLDELAEPSSECPPTEAAEESQMVYAGLGRRRHLRVIRGA